MKRVAAALAMALGWFVLLGAIGVVAYQLGGHGRLAVTLSGIDLDSRIALLWKVALLAAGLGWWSDFLKHRRDIAK